jgi:hypothetical protein
MARTRASVVTGVSCRQPWIAVRLLHQLAHFLPSLTIRSGENRC